MNKSQAKFYNTSLKMNEALLELLKSKNLSSISVAEICRKAKVNRSTFYTHYNNVYELLHETRDNFMKSFLESYSIKIEELEKNEMNESMFISPQYLIPYLEFVLKNKSFFKVFVDNIGIFNVGDFYNSLFEKLWIPACKKYGVTDKKIISYMAKFYLSGMMAIILDWINNDCKDDIDFICNTIILCVRPDWKNSIES